MYNHALQNYFCPFCLFIQGIEIEQVFSVASDGCYRDEQVTAQQWPNTPVLALIKPNQPFEDIYDLPLILGNRIHEVSRMTALAMKAAYGRQGISTRQHNEPVGNQDVWHYHCHVFHRYRDDQLSDTECQMMVVTERARYARQLHTCLQVNRNE